jgi:hypothetical protein
LGVAIAAGLYRPHSGSAQATPDATPTIDPAQFVTTIDNRYFPLVPGTVFTYAGTKDGAEQRNVVTVTPETKLIAGVTCIVVRDQVFEGDTLLEDTFDWFAQDTLGRVWYFGEDSTAYEDGKTSKEGSWKTGVHGAQPGIIMQADLTITEPYRQEYLAGEAEDMGQIIETGGTITVPVGTFSDTLTTKEWSALEPDVIEHKTYAPGVGMVHSISVSGENEEFALVDIQHEAATPTA